MEYRDYYKTLGVERNASEDAIKRAYRKLAMQHHPDRNPGDKKAEDRFKEINEAYQVLSDPQKRSRYDQLGESYTRWQQRGGAPGGFDWDRWATQPGGGNVRVNMGDFNDLFGGGFSEFFSRIFGGMGAASPNFGGQPRAARPQRLSQHQPVTITLAEAYQGAVRHIDVDGRRLEVKIPPGASTGTKVRVAQAINYPNGQKGDLYLDIQLAPDAHFERKGNDLHTHEEVDLYTAVLGGEVTVSTLSGNVVLTIPPGTQPDQTFRLAGRGMPHLKQPKTYGDMLVHIKVKLPRKLTAAQKKLFEELARAQ